MNSIFVKKLRFLLLCYFITMFSESYCFDFIVGGLYYEIIDGTDEVFIFPNHGAIQMRYSGDIIIPNTVSDYSGKTYSVVGIGEYAFAMSSITSIQLPNTIRFIGNNVFYGCSKLTTLQLPNSLDSIGSNFIQDTPISNISIPSSVTKLAGSAFASSSIESVDLSNMSNNISELSENLFNGCSHLKSIIIPNVVKTVGKNCFMGCGKLSSVTFSESLTTIQSQAFYDCKSLESIELPNQIKTIGVSAFCGCSSLTTISIPESCKSIGSSAFSGCTSLQSIKIPNSVTSLGSYSTFSGCTSLSNIILSNKLTSICELAFANCTSLSSIEIPNSVTQLGDRSFAFCSNLSSVQMPESLTSIGEKVFQECSSLHSITIPATVTTIRDHAFGWCTSLESISSKIQDPTKCGMGSYVFQSIPGSCILYVPKGKVDAYRSHNVWNYYFGSRITEEATQYSMTISAFGNGSVIYNNTSIKNNTNSFTLNEGTSATITFTPDNGYQIKSLKVNDVDKKSEISNNQYTISSISANTTVEVEFEAEYKDGDKFTAKTIEGIDMTFKILSVTDKTCQVVGIDGVWSANGNSVSTDYDGDITIPTQVNGYNVISIGRAAFHGCKIRSVNIPIGVKTISNEAFSTCYELQSIVLPEGLERIGTLAFNCCTKLKSIEIPQSVQYIGGETFRYCTSLSSITIPKNVSSIGKSSLDEYCHLFEGCNLNSIIVETGNSVYDSRNNCNAIIETGTNKLLAGCKTTIIPESVSSIDSYSFYRCTGLTTISIPSNIISIGRNAFAGCTNLTTIDIPNSINSISIFTFNGCI